MPFGFPPELAFSFVGIPTGCGKGTLSPPNGLKSAEHHPRYPSAVTIKSAICEYSTMAYHGAGSDREDAVAAVLANSMHRKRRGERVDEMSMSAVGIINLLMLAGV